MGLFLKKSLLLSFLLPILLLTYSSFANNELPQARERDRKLINLNPFPYIPKGADEIVAHKPRNIFPKPTEHVYGDSTKPSIHDTGLAKPRPYGRKPPTDLCEMIKQRTANAVKKMGETTAKKLFGNNGRKVFRAGRKAGKLYLELESNCQELQNNYCPNSPSCLRMNCVMQVVEVVEATGEMTCPENCVELPLLSPCDFLI